MEYPQNSSVLQVDSSVQRKVNRQLVPVAVGVLLNEKGHFLLTTRPEGKAFAGYWEFPGGKVEPNETIEQALARELWEELGITLQTAEKWRSLVVDYPHALVELHFFRVTQWTGTLEMREAQAFTWESLPVRCSPVLPGTVPVLQWLREC